ncbi:MAG: tubulin-like doman-containing protein [Desulfobacterales bacterium]
MAEELKNGNKIDDKFTKVVPTLFIALGGTGAQILWRIRRRILNTLWGSGTGNSVRIESLTEFPFAEFLHIDLNAFETEQGKAQKSDILANKVQFEESERLVKKLDLNKYTKSDEDLDRYKYVKEWFPLSRKTINELNIDPEKGAGQIRSISRLYFFDKYEEIKSAIRSKTDSLLDNVQSDLAQNRLGLKVQIGALKIVVVASTAGGTGSGSFLDLGYLSGWLGKDANQGVITNLVLMLPSGYKGAGLTRTEANTYAALMELETCMRQGSRYIKQWTAEIPRDMPNSPYSDVYLVDTANLAGAKTGDIKDLYDMIADSLFEDFSTAEFANMKRSISVNQNLYKVVPYEMPLPTEYGNMNLTFSRAFSSFGQATIDTHIEQKKNVVLFRQVNEMLKAFFGVASDDPKSNTPTEGERDDILANRMYLGVDNEIVEYDFVAKNEIYKKGVERTTYPLVTELLRVNGISKLDDIEKRIVDRFEEIRTSGNYKEWPTKVAETITNINHDTFKAVESGSGLHEDAIRKRRADLLIELLDPSRDHGLIRSLWMRVDNKERGGLDYTIELVLRIKDRLENANTGLVKALEENSKWFSDLSGLLRNDETAKLQEHLLQAIGQLIGAQKQSEMKLKQISEAVKLYVRYHLYGAASREAAVLVHALSEALGKQQGTDADGNPIWGGFIGEMETGRALVRAIINDAEDQIARTNEAMKQGHAMYFILPAPKSRLDGLELLPRAKARQWAEEAFQDFGGTEQLFSMLKKDEGRTELLSKLRNRALSLIGGVGEADEENPLFAALDQHPNLSQLFTDFLQRAMPWVAAKVEGYLKPQNPKDQYKCLIGVKDARKFNAKYGALLMSRLPTMTMMTAAEVGFVDIDTPGKVVCYTELSGLPLPSLKALDQWYASYRSEDKIPVHTHRVTSTFVHARELTLDELASRADDFKLFVQAVALGVLKRTDRGDDAGIYSVTRRGRIQAVGDEKKLRLVGIPEAYRPIIMEQVNGDLEQLTSEDQLATWVALLLYYSASVYPEANFRVDGTDDYRKFLPTLMCEKVVEEWTRRLERKAGQGTVERLLRTATNAVRDCTDEIPGSTSDVYPYEVNAKEIQPKRVLRREVLQPGWTLQQPGVAQPQIGTQVSTGPPRLPQQVQIQLYVALNGQQAGPFDINTLQQMVRSGQLTRDSLVWIEGMTNWAAASTVAVIASVFGVVPPPLPPGH